MTTLQKEVCRRLPEVDCTARYEEEGGRLNIDYQGTALLSLNQENMVLFREENHQPEDRLAQYYKVNQLIRKAEEYVRLYDAAPQMEAKGVEEFRRLAAYNGVVLAAREDRYFGYMFTTWRESADRRYVEIGDYSPSYDYVKESFVTRSGLIDKQRLFTDKQLKILHGCLQYTAENSENLTYKQEQELRELMRQIGSVVPETCSEEMPEHSFQQNM